MLQPLRLYLDSAQRIRRTLSAIARDLGYLPGVHGRDALCRDGQGPPEKTCKQLLDSEQLALRDPALRDDSWATPLTQAHNAALYMSCHQHAEKKASQPGYLWKILQQALHTKNLSGRAHTDPGQRRKLASSWRRLLHQPLRALVPGLALELRCAAI
jgi:hypothetical protein